MREEHIELFVNALKSAGVNFVATLPDSMMGNVIHVISRDSHFTHVPVSNENDGIGVCSGAWLCGKRPAMLMENSGLMMSTYALGAVSVAGAVGGVPILLLITYRGEIGEGSYWYAYQGEMTEPLLQVLHIPYHVCRKAAELEWMLRLSRRTLDAVHNPVAILLGGEFLWR